MIEAKENLQWRRECSLALRCLANTKNSGGNTGGSGIYFGYLNDRDGSRTL